MHTRVISPGNVLDCVKALRSHLLTPEKKRVALGYSSSMKLALRLVGVSSEWENGALVWSLGSMWRLKLRWAGLDPESWDVVDEYMWALAWQQLIGTGTFRIDAQKRSLEMGKVAPEPSDHVLVMGNSIRHKENPPGPAREGDAHDGQESVYTSVLRHSIRNRLTNR